MTEQARAPDLHDLQLMGISIVGKRPFEDAVARGVPDTSECRDAFEHLKMQIDDIFARGGAPDLLAE